MKKGHSATNLRNCEVTTIYQSILDIIDDAEETLDIVTWHFNALNRLPKFEMAVKDAISRGVIVRLYSNSKENHPNLQNRLIAYPSWRESAARVSATTTITPNV